MDKEGSIYSHPGFKGPGTAGGHAAIGHKLGMGDYFRSLLERRDHSLVVPGGVERSARRTGQGWFSGFTF